MALIVCSGICGSRARGYLPVLLLDREIVIAILDVAKLFVVTLREIVRTGAPLVPLLALPLSLAAHKLCARLAFLRAAIRHARVHEFYVSNSDAGQMTIGGRVDNRKI